MALTHQEYKLWLDTYLPLMLFAGIQKGILDPKTSLKEFDSFCTMADKFECRQLIVEDLSLVTEYIERKRKRLSTEQLSILQGVQKCIYGKFIVYKLLRHGAVFVKDDMHYFVHPLGDPFDVLIDEVPGLILATILPFKDKIIYDGFIQPYNIHFGPNIRKSMRADYLEAKEKGMILYQIQPGI